MCNNRQHDSENVRLRHENAQLATEIVKLKKYVRQQMDAHSGLVRKNKELVEIINARNTAQDWPAWRITFQSSDQAGQAAFAMLKQARDEIEKLNVMINQGIA